MNKKAFSLIEVLISIALFSIILLFLYDTLDITTKSNQFYTKKLQEKRDKNEIKKLLFLDLAHKESSEVVFTKNREDNDIISFETKNTYHNPFYTQVSYLLTKENSLMRIESKTRFNKDNLTDYFFSEAFVDIIETNIEKLKIKKVNNRYFFYIKYKNNEKIHFKF